jgi:hypothetical protein
MIAPIARPICRHCGCRVVTRPRGLCWTCYYLPGVRDRYETIGIYARRGVANGYRHGTMPEPTTALPGTAEKVAVLEQRAAVGQALWHPSDAQTEI